MGVGLVVEDAVGFSENSGSIQLKTVMQRLAVLGYIDLLQRDALICYCNVPLKLAPVEVVMQSVSSIFSKTLTITSQCIFGPSFDQFDTC